MESDGHKYNYKCPRCGNMCWAEFVDVGFGWQLAQQMSPYICDNCHWVERGCTSDECYEEKCKSWKYCLGISQEKKERNKMLKVVEDISFRHETYVAEEVDKLQMNGYEVYEIVKKQRENFLGFGRNITWIFYRKVD